MVLTEFIFFAGLFLIKYEAYQQHGNPVDGDLTVHGLIRDWSFGACYADMDFLSGPLVSAHCQKTSRLDTINFPYIGT